MPYRQLNDSAIHETIERLERRVRERFPDAGLTRVAHELTGVSRATRDRVKEIRRPIAGLRLGIGLLLLLTLGALALVPLVIREWRLDQSAKDLAETLDSTLGTLVFIGAFVIFLVSMETRVKRGRALKALHELRSLAHVIDMHQLTKDPAVIHRGVTATQSSPERTMSEYELGRYFDYCSEMLALISKIAALFVQDFPDHVVSGAVDDIETLTTGLSRKIWQKAMLLHQDTHSA